MNFWQDKRVIVTGGAGFLGSYVIEKLKERGCNNIFIPLVEDYDLTKEKNIIKLYQDYPADIVIHLAAVVGGIGANQENPGKFFYDNLVMGAMLMEYTRQFKVDKLIAIGTIWLILNLLRFLLRKRIYGMVIRKRPMPLMDWLKR